MSFPLINPYQQFFDSSAALAAGTIEFRDPTSNDLIDSFPTADDADAQTNANANPLTLSATGAATAGLFLEDGIAYKVILKDVNGATVTTQDDVRSPVLTANPSIDADETAVGLTTADIDVSYPDFSDVRRYKADQTGITSAVTSIKNCIAVQNQRKMAGNAGVYGALSVSSGTNPVVDLGDGVYKIDSALVIVSAAGVDYIHFKGDGAQLVDATQLITCFHVEPAFDLRFTGIKFRGFAKAVSIDTNNVNTQLVFDQCSFIDQKTNSVVTSADSNSTQITFINCYQHSDETACVPFDMLCDFVTFKDCWFHNNCDVTFKNNDHLLIDSSVFIPVSPTNTQRWIDNFGDRCMVKHSRVGGEGGGKRLVDHRKAIDSSGTINAVQLLFEDLEYYAVDEYVRFYEFPNLFQVDKMADDTPSTASDGIWVDAVSAAQLKAFQRYGTIDIDPRWGRVRVTNNPGVGSMFELKNLKTNPQKIITKRIPRASLVTRGDASSGWAETAAGVTAGAGTNEYAATTRTYTATADDQSVLRQDVDFLVGAEQTDRVYTYCQEITWTPNSNLGQCELLVKVGYEEYVRIPKSLKTCSFFYNASL